MEEIKVIEQVVERPLQNQIQATDIQGIRYRTFEIQKRNEITYI